MFVSSHKMVHGHSTERTEEGAETSCILVHVSQSRSCQAEGSLITDFEFQNDLFYKDSEEDVEINDDQEIEHEEISFFYF